MMGSKSWLSSLFVASLVRLATAAVLVDFQVAQPVPVPKGVAQCTVEVFQTDFGNSFGGGEVVTLGPPTAAGCPPVGSWSAVTLNLTVTSNGTQFDRLGIVNFHNVEIWRTSTPEPTRDGIIWTYIKDVTEYIPLFEESGLFIMQLDNLVNNQFTGIYSATMSATYYGSSRAAPPAPKANAIIPLSTLSNTTGNDASVPPAFSINVTLPQNTVKVFAEILPSGNANEEFWYTLGPDEFFPGQHGPFREVRLLIDGKVAGVAFPYPVIFTGGISPPMWRPITSYGALELPNYALDVTPFVPILTDGKSHNFTIDVLSAEVNNTVGQNWFVSGLLQVFTDPSGKPTTGNITKYEVAQLPTTDTTGNENAFTVKASHSVHIESTIVSGSGKVTKVVWNQALSYENQQQLTDLAQILTQTTKGTVLSTHNGVPAVIDDYSFPIFLNFTELTPDGSQFDTVVDHSYQRTLLPSPVKVQSTINNRQMTFGFFQEASTGNSGFGSSNNTFSFNDVKGHTYSRKVDATNNTITLDQQSGNLAPTNVPGLVNGAEPAPFTNPKPSNAQQEALGALQKPRLMAFAKAKGT